MRNILLTALAATAVTLAACGGERPTTSAPAPAPAPVEASADTAPAATAGASVAVKAATSPLGQILVDATGRTLYAFTNDVDAQSTCTGTCAEAWPPLLVDATWTVAPGLDSGVFSTTARDDGTLQLMAGKFPLYYFSGDARPGDVNGQGSGDVWFVVDGAAAIVRDASSAASNAAPTEAPTSTSPAALTVRTAQTELGTILVDEAGRTLYGFTKDANGTPTCTGGCATAWPPALVDGAITTGSEIATDLVTGVEAPGDATQLKAGKWPLYRFSGDSAPGDVNGQGSGGSWFVVGADGKLVKG